MSIESSALNVERFGAAGCAVFLSYASQDAEAAKRICDALRAAGVEVWFDQSELVGGDAWDAKIRKQLKECALFVPVISASTQARAEGYFRLEWKLAVDRSHLMADDQPFLFPVVIDDTPDAAARVPDKFRDVQWTRLPGGETPEKFCERVKMLLGGGSSSRATASSAPASREFGPPGKKLSRRWFGPSLLVAVGVAALALLQPWRKSAEDSSGASPVTEVASRAAELARVRARIVPDRWQKEDFAAVSTTLDRLIQTNPEESDAWALRSIINSLESLRNFDPGTKPLETGKTAADRALRLSPRSSLAELARGMHLTAMISRGGDPQVCRPFLDRAIAALPPDALTRFAELSSRLFGYDFAGVERAARAWLQAEPSADYPAWLLAVGYVANRRVAEAEEWAERAAKNQDNTGTRALGTLFAIKFFQRADLESARAALERVPANGRSVHRIVYFRWLQAMAEKHWDAALQVLASLPEPVLGDVAYHGPKALLAGQAHQRAGRPEAAAAQFREAERQLRELLLTDADNEELHAVLALTLAGAGRGPEARGELGLIEPLIKQRPATVFRSTLVALIAETRGVLGDFEDTAFWLRKLLAEPSNFPFTPASVRLDPRFAGTFDSAPVRALLTEFAGLDPEKAATAPSPVADKSVAVLAFANLSSDKEQEYFSDGISEELLNVLAKIPGLKVTARTSSFHFKGKDTAIAEIAQKLGVAYVVEGSVRKSGDKVRITAQLIKAADGFHVWSDTFTRDLKDIFAVQDEIAGLIAKQLQLKLGTTERVKKVVDPEAYRLVLEGRYFWLQRTDAGLAHAEASYMKALEYDAQFAQAHAGLADVWSIRAWYKLIGGNTQAGDDLARASTAVRLAIQIDPTLAEAHATLGAVLFNQRKFSEADQAFQTSLRLNPNYGFAHHWYAQMLFAEGRPKEGMLEFDRAISADPLAFISLASYAVFLSNFGLYEEALAMNDRALALRPEMFVPAAAQRANILLNLGRKEEAIAIARSVIRNAAMQPRWWMDGTVIQVMQATGHTEEAEAYAAQLLQTLPANNMIRGYVLAGVGRPAEAMQQLLATGLDSSMIFSFIYDRFWDEVRKDPRLPELLAKLNIAEEYQNGREALAQIRQDRERKK